MILSYADLNEESKFVCPWHLVEGRPCGQSLAGASVVVNPDTKKYVPVKQLIDRADNGERQVFWCPSCEGAIYIAPVEQGFKIGIPTP